MPKKKSLADELADLFNPAPTKEYDPEADVFGAGPALEESDDELAAEPTGRRRISGDLVMEGKEYSGRRSSRAALFGGEEEASSEGEDDAEGEEGEGADASGLDEDDGEEGEQRRVAGSSSEEDEQDEDGWLNGGAASGGSSSDDDAPEQEAAGSGGAARRRAATAAGSDDDASDEEGAERGGRDAAAEAAAAGEEEMAALEREYEEMQQDEQAALEGLRDRAAKERKKALAVQAQKALWQRSLEARILLQRTLAGANRLPQGRMQAAATEADDDIAAAFGGLAADASALVGELLSLLGMLTGRNPAVAEAAAGAAATGAAEPPGASGGGEGGAGRAAEMWSRLDGAYCGFAPFRDAAVDRWHRKTTLTTGGAALRGGQLRALNQSVSTQVAMLMQDPSKVLKRTRVPLNAQAAPERRVLCPDPAAPTAKRQRVDSGSEEPAANGAHSSAADEERDSETFDDTEFYQALLREFLEGSAVAGAGNWHTGPKQRKVVDRRASKGRKLRYHIHEKLVNFMAPVELEAPQYASQLFSNLFGGGR